jgi:hypothetical protein
MMASAEAIDSYNHPATSTEHGGKGTQLLIFQGNRMYTMARFDDIHERPDCVQTTIS